MSFVSSEKEFCPVCGTILPLLLSAPCTLPCVLCGTQVQFKEMNRVLVCRVEKIYERTIADTEAANVEGGDSVVEHLCPKCGDTRATYSTMQTRSADEGQTVFYTCLGCKTKQIEYS